MIIIMTFFYNLSEKQVAEMMVANQLRELSAKE
jgi:hypothetical protein